MVIIGIAVFLISCTSTGVSLDKNTKALTVFEEYSKAIYKGGVPTCDCAFTQEATCSCIVPCPKKPGDESETEQGGTY